MAVQWTSDDKMFNNYESFYRMALQVPAFEDHVKLTEYGAAILFEQWTVFFNYTKQSSFSSFFFLKGFRNVFLSGLLSFISPRLRCDSALAQKSFSLSNGRGRLRGKML